LENVDLLISPSSFTKDLHRSEGIGRPIRVLPLFVPDAPARGAVPPRAAFLYAGRLEASKGPGALVAAAAGLDAELPALLARLAKDPGLAADLGVRGREAARRLWTEESHLAAYLEEVETRLSERARA
jgi:hypothetical protein